MRTIDRWLQRWRISKVIRWIRPGDRLLDVGCFDATLLARVADRVAVGVGIDPVAEPWEDGNLRIVRGPLPGAPVFESSSFDCVTVLAVLEHVREVDSFAAELHRILCPGGRVVVTVPHPIVDPILDALVKVRLIDGMDLGEHHGFDTSQTVPIFERAGFELEVARRFQLGLNQLFVFSKPPA